MNWSERWVARMDRVLADAERRLGPRGAALAVGVTLLVCAGLYASENFVPLGFGRNYSELAKNPFRFDRPDILQYRIFAPVLGHILGLRGSLFPVLTHGASVLFLAVLYGAARRRQWRPAEAVALAATMAGSVNVLAEVHFAGLTDPISYLGLTWALLARSAWGLGAGLSIALLNHEANLFALPWVLACGLAGRTPAERAARVAAAAVAAGALFALRAWLGSRMASDVPMDAAFYLNPANAAANLRGLLPNAWVGVFCAYKLLWALPLFATPLRWRDGARREVAWLALVVGCALAQLLIAEDVTRLMGLAFPAILWGARVLRERWGTDRFAPWLWRLLLLNLLIPTVLVFGPRLVTLYPLPFTMLAQWLFDTPL